jgi:GTP-binding protein Era
VGKSTLVNRLVGQKVSITSPRPQTTRSPIRGVRNGPGYQAVFVDTPGSQKPKDTLRARMQEQVVDSLQSRTPSCSCSTRRRRRGCGDRRPLRARLVAESGTPAIVCINKIDLLRSRVQVLPIVDTVAALGDWCEIFPISATNGINVEPLFESIVEQLPSGPRYFPEGTVTDYPESLIWANTYARRR